MLIFMASALLYSGAFVNRSILILHRSTSFFRTVYIKIFWSKQCIDWQVKSVDLSLSCTMVVCMYMCVVINDVLSWLFSNKWYNLR